jgi:hypothetical protein
MDICATGQLHHSDYREFVLIIEQRIDELVSIKRPVDMEEHVWWLQFPPDVT